MSGTTRIEWTEATWNPVSGCTRVSPGCDRCYIERTPPFRTAHRRFDGPGVGGTTGVVLHPERLDQPFRWRKPRRVFVCSLADLFHDDVPDEYIAHVFAVMALTPHITHQLLTKRPARMRALLSSGAFTSAVADAAYRMAWGEDPAVAGSANRAAARAHAEWPAAWEGTQVRRLPWPLPSVWCGVTAEDQQRADQRIPILLETPAAVRWVSAEPLLGPLDLTGHLGDCACSGGINFERSVGAVHEPGCGDLPGLDWIVVGGETGPGARPMHPDWARSLRDQCVDAGVPFLLKQWGEWASAPWKGVDGATHAFTGGAYMDAGQMVETFMELGHSPTSCERDDTTPHGAQGMRRVGRKAAGRVLDGVTHDAYPEPVR